MDVDIHAERQDDRARLGAAGLIDLNHAPDVARALTVAATKLEGCSKVDVDLGDIRGIDGSGAALLARFLDRLEASGSRIAMATDGNPEAARLIDLYRVRGSSEQAAAAASVDTLSRIGATAAQLPARIGDLLDLTGRWAAAVPQAAVAPRSVDWRSLPGLLQKIGADGLPVTAAANLLVGIIVGLMGVAQLGRFGATSFVPELVVFVHFRELGPLVTAIVVAGRSGAGIASELGTMKVSEEIDALQTMGFDPVRWLVIPRCVALIIAIPLLTWIGDGFALLGGMSATVAVTDMTPRMYLVATDQALSVGHFLSGLIKTPFLALAVGLVACGQGLATRGGAAAVGARTTRAVVLAIFAVIAIDALFTLFYAMAGI
jgi:phospholipid/cholesterol/gamma-HCH transport system permease protein